MNIQQESFNETFVLSKNRRSFLWTILGAYFVLRILMMIQVPFTDTTEARYGEMARKMVETNDWITPQIEYGVPFWGKPPLHTWVSAAGMKLFGVNEFGGRIFIFITGLVILGMLYRWAKEFRGRDYALIGITIIASNVLFFVAAATVMTDLVMIAGTTLSMVAFWSALHRQRTPEIMGYLFFVGLAIGLLAKGPVAFVLTAIPIGAWVLIHNQWANAWNRLPWISGTLLMLFLVVPWYLLAELKTPGFLEYFIVGEHFQRFLVSGWKGDLYGSGHAEPRGSIWLFGLGTLLPWTFFLLAPVRRWRSFLAGLRKKSSRWTTYLICWALAPLLFFTLATNIIPTYVITGIPASCFLIVDLWGRTSEGKDEPSKALFRSFSATLAIGFTLFLSTYLIFLLKPELAPKRTQKDLVATKIESDGLPSSPLYYFGRKNYSIEFYTAGNAIRLDDPAELVEILADSKEDFVSIDEKDFRGLNQATREGYFELGKFGNTLLISESPQHENYINHGK